MTRLVHDERSIQTRHNLIGYLGPSMSSFTLAWLATHRGRLRSLILGSKHLTVFIVLDSGGDRLACRSDADVEAVRQVVLGDPSRDG